MGLTVVLQTEFCRDVLATATDPQNYLHGLVPPPTDNSYRCLGFIDLYGDTMFNYLQMGAFLTELARIRQVAAHPDELSILDSIRDLGERCRDAQGLSYLWFYGD
jgi:hypothetical protein